MKSVIGFIANLPALGEHLSSKPIPLKQAA
jgi:hypothetical protein